jgi:hypothetical protein
MTTLPEMRDLARRLLSYEADAGNTATPAESTTVRVYEKLRQRLGELAGTAAFRSLASRALTLARSEVPSFGAVKVAEDGKLEDIIAIEPPINAEMNRDYEGGVVLISRLLELLLIFLGEALTMNLVRDVWPDAALNDRNSDNGRKT